MGEEEYKKKLEEHRKSFMLYLRGEVFLRATLLPGGQGSVAPMYELPSGTFTFYYLELALEAKLQRKVNQLKEILGRSKGQIQYDWRSVQYIQSKEQFIDWKRSMGGLKRRGGKPSGPREVLDTFKAHTMTEEDMKDEKDSRTRVTQKTVQERTWYTPEAWEHGGLRIKNEVKEEMEEGMGGSSAKRVKKE